MARAPGGKAGADSPSVSRDTMRLVTFSDGVFAITITLRVLEIRPPTDERNLLHGLLALWPSYLAYALTFLFIGQVWANHHVMFDHIRAADRWGAHQQALSARPGLARDRRPAWRPAPRGGRGRDRRVQRLLLAPGSEARAPLATLRSRRRNPEPVPDRDVLSPVIRCPALRGAT